MELFRHLSEFPLSSLFSTTSLTSPECLVTTVENCDSFREELEGGLYYAMKANPVILLKSTKSSNLAKWMDI